MGASASFKSGDLPAELTAANIRELVDDKAWRNNGETKFHECLYSNVATGTIEDTIVAVSQIVSKPKMKEKLLKRPPFRFIKDIIYHVSKETKYMEDIFATDDVQSGKAFVNKVIKQVFLQQVVDCVGQDLNVTVSTQPKKMCAGLEAEQTRQLIQLFCFAARRVEPTIKKEQFLQEVARFPIRQCARSRWKRALTHVKLSVKQRYRQKKIAMKKERARSPKNTKSKRRRASMGDLWGTVGKGDEFLEGEMSFDDLQLDDLAKDSKAASTKTLADTDEKASDNGGAAAAAAVPASPDFAPRLALILQYMLHRRNSGKSLPEGGVEVTVLEDCTAKHILKGKARAFRKAAGKLWLCKSQLQTGLFKQGLANKFDIQGLWPAGMELVSVGKGKVKGERFSAVRKAVQAAKARPLTLRFELADDFKPALASALKMDTDALRAHLQATVQECQPILCRPLEWGDATALPTDLLWAASAQMMHEIPVDQDDWGNYCNVLFEATTPQTLQWVMHALRFVEETLAIASLDTASSTYKPPISLSDTRIHTASTAVAAVMSKQALWNLNDLDDDNEPNLMALQKIARKRLQSNKNAIEQRYIACGWDKTVGSQIPSRPGQPRHNGVGLVPTPLHLLLNDDISSNGDVAYLCLLSMLAIAFRGPLTAAMDTLGGFEMAGSKGEGVHIKSFAQMLRLLSTEHSTHKEPRGASNTDILSTSRCFASVEELLAGYKRLTTIGTVLRCTNWYRAEADPPAHQPAGSRSIVAIVQFSVPSLKDPKVKIDIGTLMQLPGIVQACEEWEDSPLMAGWEDRVHEAREFLHSADVSRRAASMLVMVELMLEQHGAHRLGTQAYHLISRAQNPRELQQLFETR